MGWNGNRPGTLPRVEDDRLAELAADRTGFEVREQLESRAA